ncbi:MAG: 16S rRNA (guanine(966)-N(2))-methyltransferase RsmD [Nocardioides sp.]
MTRIIGGSAGGRRIKATTGENTRPTSDRVREALFSSLESTLGSLTGLRFLDLYAGSGAVGLEARSRGAGVVTFVEQDRRTSALVRDNARTLGFTGVEVVAAPVARALATPPRAPYDVVFLDPPYALAVDDVEADLAALRDNGWLAPGALVMIERGRRGPAPTWPEGLEADRDKRYGETVLWYGHAAPNPPDPHP